MITISECEACGDGTEAYGSCKDCSISVCYDHDCLSECSNCNSYVCYACAKTNQSDVGHCCDSCSTMSTCECGHWVESVDDEMYSCEGCGSLKCDYNCLTSCSSCGNSWCCGDELTEYRGDTVCSGCKEGLQGAVEDHFAAGAEHDQWNEEWG